MARRPTGPQFGQLQFGKNPPPRGMWRGGSGTKTELDGKAPAELTPKQALVRKRASGKAARPSRITGGPAMRNPGQGIIQKKRKKMGNGNA